MKTGRQYCEYSGKVCYPSRRVAKKAMRDVKHLHTYLCPHCHYIHITTDVQVRKKRLWRH